MSFRPKLKEKIHLTEWSWADFEDWKRDEEWDVPTKPANKKNELTEKHLAIVKNNKGLLQNKQKWDEQVFAFNTLLARDSHSDEERESMRDEFEIRFDGVNFDNYLDLHGYTFPCDVKFFETPFKSGANFTSTIYLGRARFNRIMFADGNLAFRFSKFKKGLFIWAARNVDYLNFSEIECEGNAEIHLMSEVKGVILTASSFDKSLAFTCERVKKFDASDVSIQDNFDLEIACQTANFQRLSVSGASNFFGSKFEDVPDLRNCNFARIPAVGGMVLPKPKMERCLKYLFSTVKDKSDVAKFRILKVMALSNHDHEKDGELFALEMMAKKGIETTQHLELMFNSLYGGLSFYGQSYLRPLAWMLVSFFAFWVGGLAMIKGLTNPLQEIGFAAVNSALNSMPLIGTLFRTTSVPEGHTSWYDETYHQLADKGLSPDWWAAISAGQQIIGAVLFFLFFLGLRNKFRLK